MDLTKAYQDKIEQLFDEWSTQLESYSVKLEDLARKAGYLPPEARHENLKKLEDLENKIKSAQVKLVESREKYAQLMEASDEAWDDLKSGGQMAWRDLTAGIEGAWEEMKTAIDSASTKISDQQK